MLATTIFWVVFLEAVCVLSLPVTPSTHLGTGEDSWEEDLSPEEGPFLEGDIVIGSETIPVVDLRQNLQRSLVSDPRRLWPGKEVPYEFASGQFSAALRRTVEEALQDLMDQSCVRFTRRRGQTIFLKLRETGKGCLSKVGYHEDSPSSVHLGGPKCQTKGTVQHEFLHALGFWHEHTRPDRDDYVSVLWDNIREDRKKDFVKRGDSDVSIQGLPYDYSSVMHYKHTAFSSPRGTTTLVPKNKKAVAVMGQRRGVTQVDIAKLNRLYNCTDGYYRGDDLEGLSVMLGEIVETRKRREPRSKSEEVFQNICKEDVREGCESDIFNESVKNAISSLMKWPTPEVLKSQKFDEEEILSILDQPIQMRVKKVLAEKIINSQTIKSSEINIIINKTNEMKTIVNSVLRNSARRKRETFDMAQQNGKTMEIEQLPTDGQHDTFAPQKILPELLKGVLGNDKDRPIVIQFAIYQPVVYKTPNESESSSDKKPKQNVEKHIKEENTDRKMPKESNVREDREEETIQIRSLRDRENFFRENSRSEEHEDDVIIHRTENGDETQRKKVDDFERTQQDRYSARRDSETADKYSEHSKEVHSSHDDDFSDSTRHYIQPLKASQNNDNYSQKTEIYDDARRPSNINQRQLNVQRENYSSHQHPYDESDDKNPSHLDKSSIPFHQEYKATNGFISSREDSLEKKGYHSEYVKDNIDFSKHDSDDIVRKNLKIDSPRGLSISDHDSRSEITSYDRNSDTKESQPMNLRPYDDSHFEADGHDRKTSNSESFRTSGKIIYEYPTDSDSNHRRNDNTDSIQTTSSLDYHSRREPVSIDDHFSVHDEHKEKPTNTNNKDSQWYQKGYEEKYERNGPESTERVNIDKLTFDSGHEYRDMPNMKQESGGGSNEGKPKRQNSRPDLYIEETMNDELDKQIRRKKMEKESVKEDLPEDRTLPQEFNDKRVIIEDVDHSALPINKFNGGLKSLSQKKTSSNEEQENKQDYVTDSEFLVSKPHSMLNLNPRQALPLNAPSKSATKRLIRIEKVQSQGTKKSISEK